MSNTTIPYNPEVYARQRKQATDELDAVIQAPVVLHAVPTWNVREELAPDDEIKAAIESRSVFVAMDSFFCPTCSNARGSDEAEGCPDTWHDTCLGR